jgi:hypothetical protein
MMDLELARLVNKETELAGVLVFNFKELFGRLSCIAHNCTPQVDSFIIPLCIYPQEKKTTLLNLCNMESGFLSDSRCSCLIIVSYFALVKYSSIIRQELVYITFVIYRLIGLII